MKLLIIVLILLQVGFIAGAQLLVERVGETSLLTLYIDYDEVISKDNQIDYRAIFEIFNNEGEVVSLTKKNIKLSSDDFPNNNRIIIFLEELLKPGSYTAFLKLNNNLRNDKKEEKFDFSVDKNQHFSKLYMLLKLQDYYLEVLSWDEVKDSSDVYLYQLYKEKIHDLKLISESKEERKVTDFPDTSKLDQKLNKQSILPDFTNNYIEFTLDGKLYQQEITLAKQLNSFQRKYSWDDQLEQIKYIVNDRKWKEINRNSKLNQSEKVLEFWDSFNPSNSTKNELQEIFYNRILIADQKFSVHKYKNGWQTDRGRIYIKFGEPDEISVDNFPIDKYPTQTWYYYLLNKTFHFYDRTRIEDYQLYNKEEEYGH
ncbi:GWxTD domain-containing protein [bacterium]|nr:GWxTD domain-containing protein [bacterium]